MTQIDLDVIYKFFILFQLTKLGLFLVKKLVTQEH